MVKYGEYDFERIFNYIKSSKFLQQFPLEKYISDALGQNEYGDDEDRNIMWKEQCIINFPLLYITSVYLYLYAMNAGCDTFLFASRDCCHWYKIFKTLFPKANAHYFHCSRIMFEGALGSRNKYFKEYVKSIVKDVNKTIFVDIHGTCRRVFRYFTQEFGDVPHGFLISATKKRYTDFQDITQHYWRKGKFINLVFDARGSPIESLNYDNIGTLQDFDKNGPIRDKLEYPSELIKVYHNGIDVCTTKLDPLQFDISRKKSKFMLKKLHEPVRKMFKFILNDKPRILKFIKHKGNHVKNETAGYLIDYDQLVFEQIISNDSVYSIVWQGKYGEERCAIKMVMLDSGVYMKDEKCYKGKHVVSDKYFSKNDADPYRHNDFKTHKALTKAKFLDEVKNLVNLDNAKLSPIFFGYYINDYEPVHYGFIVMGLMDCSVKHILLKRSLKSKEEKVIYKFIHKMHGDGVIHGDLKPSNIGVYLDKYGYIEQCLVFDCQKVSIKGKSPRHLIKDDWKTFKKHVEKNTDERRIKT